MYRCSLCQVVSKPRQPRLLYTLYRSVPVREAKKRAGPVLQSRTRKEVAREIPVCAECHVDLQEGTPIQALARPHAKGTRKIKRGLAPETEPAFELHPTEPCCEAPITEMKIVIKTFPEYPDAEQCILEAALDGITPVLLCDLCSSEVDAGGQVTADSVICSSCLEKHLVKALEVPPPQPEKRNGPPCRSDVNGKHPKKSLPARKKPRK